MGDPHASFRVYIANQPDFPPLQPFASLTALSPNDIYALGQHCGNGWRKVFNVYAKLLYALADPRYVDKQLYSSWQAYRDNRLLQAQSGTALLFSPVLPDEFCMPGTVHLILGRTYAKTLYPPQQWLWLDHDFALINTGHRADNNRVMVCPYFDYRQLSNSKIIRLVSLLQHTLPLSP